MPMWTVDTISHSHEISVEKNNEIVHNFNVDSNLNLP